MVCFPLPEQVLQIYGSVPCLHFDPLHDEHVDFFSYYNIYFNEIGTFTQPFTLSSKFNDIFITLGSVCYL